MSGTSRGTGGRWRGYPRYVWRRTLHNWPQKILALLTALVLWFLATSDRRATVDRSFTAQLRVLGDGAPGGGGGKRSVSDLPQNVRVTLSGPSNDLVALSGDDIEASINVADLPEGSFQVPIRVRAPVGFRVVRYSPTVASGFVDAETTRTLNVQLAVTGLPTRALPRYALTPRTVQVTGPERLVNSVASVTTVPVSLPRGASAEARLLPLNGNGQPVAVRLNPATVSVERTDQSDLPIKVLGVQLADAPAEFEVVSAEISPPSVRVLADPATLAGLSAVTARVPYREGTYSAQANLQLPGGARSLDAVTVTLDVRRARANP